MNFIVLILHLIVLKFEYMYSAYLIPWPGPHVTPVMLIKEHLELIAMQSSPTNQGNNYENVNKVKLWCML